MLNLSKPTAGRWSIMSIMRTLQWIPLQWSLDHVITPRACARGKVIGRVVVVVVVVVVVSTKIAIFRDTGI